MKSTTPIFSSPKSLLKRRMWAFFVDLFGIIIIHRLIMLSFSNFLKTFFYQLPYISQFNLQSNMAQIHLSTLALVFVGHFFLSYYLGEGKTPGKMLFGLRVYPDHEAIETRTRLNFVECLARSGSYLFCYILGSILFMMPFLRKDAKGVPDFLSGTRVYDEKEYEVYQMQLAQQTSLEQLTLFEIQESQSEQDKEVA